MEIAVAVPIYLNIYVFELIGRLLMNEVLFF